MNKRTYWVLIGPGFLFFTLVLLIYQAGFLLARPVWLSGLCLSSALACGISYMISKEILSQATTLSSQTTEKTNEVGRLRGVLDEAQKLYREKIEKLEQAFVSLETESGRLLEEKEASLDALKYEYEEINGQAIHAKNQADSFHTSLKDALDELRALRQMHFLIEEHEKEVPKDIINQHKQLRAQFEEKSMILDQTRHRLFVIEGHLHGLKQQTAMEKLDRQREEETLVEMLGKMIEENESLEKEIQSLEKILSSSLNPPKATKSKKQLQEILEFQFDKTSF